MKDDSAIQTWLLGLFKEKLEREVASLETDLIETGLLDSLIFVELLFQIEKEFGITLPVDQLEIEYFRTINSIVEFIGQPRETV
jgi:D-alanine--poly(phosphoribitol) ligase subunit 2